MGGVEPASVRTHLFISVGKVLSQGSREVPVGLGSSEPSSWERSCRKGSVCKFQLGGDLFVENIFYKYGQ